MREGSPPPTCHVSGVTCHMTLVTCHMSHITISIIIFIIFLQSCEASQWRVCYQQGLPFFLFYRFGVARAELKVAF